jgi:hypothetical protein
MVYVHNSSHGLCPALVVMGAWSGGASGTSSCTTGSLGRCTLTSPRVALSAASITFTVTGVSKSGFTYDPSANHDPDGDSTGTVITVIR